MYSDLREPGRVGSRQSMTEAQANDALALLRNRLAQAEAQQRGLSQRLGVRVAQDGRASIDANAGLNLRDVPSQHESEQRLQESLERIYGAMGRPEAESRRLAEAGVQGLEDAPADSDMEASFLRIFNGNQKMAEAAAKGRDW